MQLVHVLLLDGLLGVRLFVDDQIVGLTLALDLLVLFVRGLLMCDSRRLHLYLLELLNCLLLSFILLLKLLDSIEELLVLLLSAVELLNILCIVLLKMLSCFQDLLSLNMVSL